MDDVMGMLGSAVVWQAVRRLLADAPPQLAVVALVVGAELIWWRASRRRR